MGKRTAAAAITPAPATEPSPEELADLIRQWLTLRERGKKTYQRAGELLKQIQQVMQPGVEVDLGDGRRAHMRDKFASGRTYVREDVYVNRFDLEITS